MRHQEVSRRLLQVFFDPLDDQLALMWWRINHHDCIFHVRNEGCVTGRFVEDNMDKFGNVFHRICDGDIIELAKVAPVPKEILPAYSEI